mmetsp:Transcript_42375/g.136935  ORF Transcript_42375/g.136935 Transcript_42375/m.136935 type:complete len:136 (-) Transcript_42375:879-1286(-)
MLPSRRSLATSLPTRRSRTAQYKRSTWISLPSPEAAPMVASMLCHIELIETKEVQVLAALEFQVERSETKEVLVPEPSLVAAIVVPTFRFPKSGWMVPQCSRCRHRIHSDLSTVHCCGAVMTPVWFSPPEGWVSC